MISIVMEEMRNRSLTDEQLRKGLENEEKSEEQLEDFLFEYAKNKANESRNNKAIAIEREEIFGQAVHYFTETNKMLGLDKKEEDKAKKEKQRKEIMEHNEWLERVKKENEERKRQKQIEKQGFEDLTIFDFGVE